MRLEKTPAADASGQLSNALRKIRIGDYEKAKRILDPLRHLLPSDTVDFPAIPKPHDYYLLRLSTLVAEVEEYRGDYDAARDALRPYLRIIRELREMKPKPGELDFNGPTDKRRLILRQKLYFLWQKSVWYYRTGDNHRSRALLDVALHLAEQMTPRSEALLTQLYYGAGKLAFHECRESEATVMYRQSLMSASQRLDIARRAYNADASAPESNDAFMDNEVEAARYSVAKTLALGLGQCLREAGRLEEAHTQVVAGRLLLNLGADRELSYYARLLLGSIERSIAGEKQQDLLQHAGDQISECARYFVNHRGEVGYRSRLELALIAMQQNRLDEARQALEAMLAAEPDPKWRAECNLGLSRVARREKKYDDAVEFARASVHAADGLERIRRRAHTVLVLALYDAAIAAGDDERRDFHLKATLREIERALMPSAEPDVRTRANLLLTRARVFKTQGDIAAALDVYKEFEAIKPLVEVGRIHELAKLVEKELAPVMNTFRCPADHVPPVWNLDVNLDALREYVKEKAERKFKTGRARAAALGRSRGNLYADLKKPKNGVPRKRAGRGSGSATGRKKSN